MAKQVFDTKFTGRIGKLVFYKSGNDFLIRGTPGERYKGPENQHERTMQNANWFAQATRIAKSIYRLLPTDQRDQHTVWYPLRNKAQELVREGKAEKEIVSILREMYGIQ